MDEGQWDRQRTSFGAKAATYDAYRPDWPGETAAWLTGDPSVGASSVGGEREVLDLGAGTGKLTRTLVDLGHRVTAVDPSGGMLSVLAAALPQVEVAQAEAESLPFGANSFDAVTVAQAWHWVDQAAATAECARILRPGGVLGLGWHLRRSEDPMMDELDGLVGNPEYRARKEIRDRVSAVEIGEPFGPTERRLFDHRIRLTPEGLAGLASSWSYVAVRDDRATVLDEVEALGRRSADAEGLVAMTYVTHCYRARLGE